MTKIRDYSEFPDVNRYAELEQISPEALIEAFKVEHHYHQLLLKEKDSAKRLGLYDELYSKVIPIYGRDPNLNNGYNSKDKYVKLFSRELRDASIVDLGCGSGNMLQSIDKHLKTKSLTGIDVVISEKLKAHKRIRFIESNIINFKFKETFDVAFSDNVIEHLVPEDANIHIKSVFNNLNPNGRLIIIMPNRLFGPWDITRIKDFSQSGKLAAEGGHVNESTHTEMTRKLKEIGFKEVLTILPIPKLKYSLFKRIRLETHWIEKIENTPFLLKFVRNLKLNGVCRLNLPVTLIARK